MMNRIGSREWRKKWELKKRKSGYDSRMKREKGGSKFKNNKIEGSFRKRRNRKTKTSRRHYVERRRKLRESCPSKENALIKVTQKRIIGNRF